MTRPTAVMEPIKLVITNYLNIILTLIVSYETAY